MIVINENCRLPDCDGNLVVKRTTFTRQLIEADDGKVLHNCDTCSDGFAWLDGIYPREVIPSVDLPDIAE